jgi:hypothetical protein
VQAAGRPTLLSTSILIATLFYRHVRLWFCDALSRCFSSCECCGISSAGAHQGVLSSIWMMYENADGFVSGPWLSVAVRRRLNLYGLI